ncbi:Crp/Fnr family transcriptional regulator [Limibacter armeniacum]|uniref:Crp/Fnr family transcriptional regulator n=1 Tax=Limibacter armeniacum TaxID=466084 RepID=UPI002FE64E14
MFEKFIKLVSYYLDINNDETLFLKNHVPIVTYRKNETFFSEGNISKTIYFVLNGCVRLYYNVDGVDKTAFFYTEGKFICAGESYTFNVPAKENFEAVEDTVLMHFDKSMLETLLSIYPRFEVLARIAVEDELLTCQQMIASFVTKSPEERYMELLSTNGQLFQRVPQQYIASFLGVSQETLSRIKKRVKEKEAKMLS